MTLKASDVREQDVQGSVGALAVASEMLINKLHTRYKQDKTKTKINRFKIRHL